MSTQAASPTRTVTIYALTDPDSGEVRYVGQTIGDPVKRHYEHIVASHGAQCTPLGFWIRELAENGQVPGLTILETQVAPHRNAEREGRWISYYSGNGAPLLNKTTATVSRWAPPLRPMHGHPLRLWRKRYRMSHQEFAAACGISQSMVSLIETGLRIPLNDTLERLISYTGLPADAFVRTERFLEEQPDFLRKYRRKGRGGPRR
jgi:helix-turn-helix protein